MTNSPHLLRTTTYHRDGTDAKSVCGKEVRKAVAVTLWDGELFVTWPENLCRKCVEVLPKAGGAVSLLYEIVPGEQLERMKARSR